MSKIKQPINKMIPCDLDTHTMVKEQAAKANMQLGEYVKSCAISCKSDAGKKQTASTSTHNDLMQMFDLPIESTKDDLLDTCWLEIYEYVMQLKG